MVIHVFPTFFNDFGWGDPFPHFGKKGSGVEFERLELRLSMFRDVLHKIVTGALWSPPWPIRDSLSFPEGPIEGHFGTPAVHILVHIPASTATFWLFVTTV